VRWQLLEITGRHRSVKDLVENLLFLAPEPLSLTRIAEAVPHSKEEIAAALDALQAEYSDRGLKLRYVSGGWEITSDPDLADAVQEFFNLQRRKHLSRQALETLAVIAYNQPITRGQIEAIRGVQTTGTLHTLLESNLIRVVGQRDSLGNPYLYGTTDEFLRHFGLGDVSELPPLEFEHESLAGVGKAVEPGNGEAEGIVTPVEFGFDESASEKDTNVQQKGA